MQVAPKLLVAKKASAEKLQNPPGLPVGFMVAPAPAPAPAAALEPAPAPAPAAALEPAAAALAAAPTAAAPPGLQPAQLKLPSHLACLPADAEAAQPAIVTGTQRLLAALQWFGKPNARLVLSALCCLPYEVSHAHYLQICAASDRIGWGQSAADAEAMHKIVGGDEGVLHDRPGAVAGGTLARAVAWLVGQWGRLAVVRLVGSSVSGPVARGLVGQ